MALPLQATNCGDTIQLVRGLAPLIPRMKGRMCLKKRTNEIKIRLSPAELTTLNEHAKKAGLSREEFCRRAIKGAQIKEAPPADLPKLTWEVRRVGSNIDQILKIANARGLLDVPQLRKAISDLRDVEKLIVSTYTGR